MASDRPRRRASGGGPKARPHPVQRTSGGPKKYVGPKASLEAQRRRNRTLAYAAVGAAVAVVAVLLLVKALGGSSTPSATSSVSPAAGVPAPAAITEHLTSVPLARLAAAPTSGVAAPTAIHDSALVAGGKPDLLFIGAEFCPICATERWAMYVALSKFGTFTPAPGQIHSAVADEDIATVTFYKTTYTSPYFTFTPVETTTNQPSNGYYVTLQTPTAAQQKLWSSHTTQTFPWLDFGGKMQLNSAQFDPSELHGMSFQEIASQVGNNSTVVGGDIDSSARVLIQTICATLSNHRPANVCRAVGA